MRYCTHPSHADESAKTIPWIQDDEPDHDHTEEDLAWLND